MRFAIRDSMPLRLRHFLERFSKGSWRRFEGVSEGPLAETGPRTHQNPFRDRFRNPASETFWGPRVLSSRK